ncbi:MAG: Gfo/Idh/MocA family oxidoreductase [Clostridia bacterium]|nr:Gfo/Idh/MocA family oxidoreductase [Clostridia bacterium]
MIQVAIIGTGNISHAHIHAYLLFPERVHIAALVDIIPGKAEKVKKQYGLDCDCYLDHHNILTRPDIDLVDCCTPPYVHAEITINALHSGKNALCEKPMAASLEECDAMIRARDASGKKLSVIAQNRFRKPIRDLKALLDSGIAGPVRACQVDSFWWRGHCYYDLWWRGTWEKEGGGCTLNHAVHHIDMLGWMMGLPQRVTSVLANTAHDNAEVEDLSMSIMEYPGALGLLTASVVHHGEEQTLTFQCEKAKIAAPFSVYASVSRPNGFPEENPQLEAEIRAFTDSLPPVLFEGHDGQIDNVLTAMETDTLPAISGEDGRTTIELITAIYKSGALKAAVSLPLSKDDPFYTVQGIQKSVPHFYEKTVSQMELGDSQITLGSFDKTNR